MPFQPFGYHFEVRLEMSPDAVKAAIRSRKRRLFDAKDGARGWIVGPFICLTSSRDRNAPMLMGCILRDGSGTRVIGRAGYVASAQLLALTPFFIFFFYWMLARGGYTFTEVEILAGSIVLATLLISSWRNHHDAEPLVRFLHDMAGQPDQSRRASPMLPLPAKFTKSLTLEISGSQLDGPITPMSVRDALQDMEDDSNGFVILSSADEHYVQTVSELGGYIVEKREGDDNRHYRAARHGSADNKDVFTFEEALTIFLAYGAGKSMPAFLEWKKIRV